MNLPIATSIIEDKKKGYPGNNANELDIPPLRLIDKTTIHFSWENVKGFGTRLLYIQKFYFSAKTNH